MKPICELYALKMQIKHNNFHSKMQSQITATISQILLEVFFLRAKAFKIPKIVIGKKNPKKTFPSQPPSRRRQSSRFYKPLSMIWIIVKSKLNTLQTESGDILKITTKI